LGSNFSLGRSQVIKNGEDWFEPVLNIRTLPPSPPHAPIVLIASDQLSSKNIINMWKKGDRGSTNRKVAGSIPAGVSGIFH